MSFTRLGIFLVLSLCSTQVVAQNRSHLISGSLAGQVLSDSNWKIAVEPGTPITGTVRLLVHNVHTTPSVVVPVGYTWTWGSRESAIVTARSDVPPGDSVLDIPINLTAPSTNGVYYIIFAHRGEFNMSQVLSATNWQAGPVRWHDGNDYHDMTGEQLELAHSSGDVPNWQYLFSNGYRPISVAAAPIKVTVGLSEELSIYPRVGGDIGSVSVFISGRRFTEGATVKLIRDGQSDIVGDPVSLSENSLTITTTFDLTGKARGVWNVVVENPDTTSFILSDGFTIEEGRAAQVWVDIVGRNVIRTGREQRFHILYGNLGNIDIYEVFLKIKIPDIVTPKIIIPDFDFGIPEINSIMVPQEALIDNEKVILLWIYSLPAGSNQSVPLSIQIPSEVNSGRIPITVKILTSNSTTFSTTGNLEHLDESQAISIAFSSVQERYRDVTSMKMQKQQNDVDWDHIHNVMIEETRESIKRLRELQDPSSLSDLGKNMWYHLWNFLKRPVPFSDFIDLMDPQFAVTTTLILERQKEIEHLYDILDGRKTPSIVTSYDPNDKVGSQGSSDAQYISGEEPLRYSIFFENLETASAPAQEVVITDQLDTVNMNLNTLSLGPITFGDTIITPSPGLSAFTTEVSVPGQVLASLTVKIEVSLNPNTGLLTWRLTSIDPATGELPEDPLAGFLPPNNNPPEGDGSVLFTIMPKGGLSTGTVIRNQAEIIFDVNDPIVTPEWLNTLDNTKPTSQVQPLDSTQNSTDFTVEWLGTDNGSGVKNYTIFVSEDNGPFTVWLGNTPDTSGTFSGESGKTYAFYSVARDQTGNTEMKEPVAEATTQVNASSVKDPGYPYVDVNNDGLFTAGMDVSLTNGEVQDGTFDVKVSEGSYDAAAAECDTDGCGLVIPASTGPISAQGFTYISDGNLVVNTNLTGTRPTTTSSLESRSGSVLLDDPTLAAPRNLSIKAANDIIATNGDTIRVDQTQGFLTLEAGGNIDVTGSLVKGGRTFTITAGGQIIATGATLENTDFNAGTTVLTTNGGPITIEDVTVRGGRQTVVTASGDIDASKADILITTSSSGPYVQLNSGGSINVTDASITDSGGRSTIDLKADIDIDCTGSTLTADTVNVMAGGSATNCP